MQAQSGEDPSSSESEEDMDEAAARNDEDEAEESSSATQGRPSCNGAAARAADGSNVQGGSSGKVRAEDPDDSLRTYLDIVMSSQLDSEKTSTISALLHTERDHRVLSCFQEKGKWVGTGEAAHFQGTPAWSMVAAALRAHMPHASIAVGAASSRHAQRCRSGSRSQGAGKAPQEPDAHQEQVRSAPEVPAALPQVPCTPSSSQEGAKDLSARALGGADDVALGSEGCASRSAAPNYHAHSAAEAARGLSSQGKRLKEGAQPVSACAHLGGDSCPRDAS